MGDFARQYEVGDAAGEREHYTRQAPTQAIETISDSPRARVWTDMSFHSCDSRRLKAVQGRCPSFKFFGFRCVLPSVWFKEAESYPSKMSFILRRTVHSVNYVQTHYVNGTEPDEDNRRRDLVSSTKKIPACSRQGNLLNARRLFDRRPFRDSVSYNIMIRDYIRNGRIEDARDIFERMPERNTISWNSMIMGYSLRRNVHVALKLFIVMPDRCKDIFSWTTVISGLARGCQFADSLELFRQLPQPTSVAWASIMSGFQQNGLAYETLMLFKEMLSLVTRPASHSFTSAFTAAADLSLLFLGRQLYSQVIRRGLGGNTHIGNSVISMFMKSGSLDCARTIFHDMPHRDLFTWNSMITGFGHHGLGAEAISTFHQMQRVGFQPDAISFLGVLQGCSHSGYVNEGQIYFGSMQRDFNICPEPEHYACLVDILARAGLLRKAVKVISDMPFEATPVFWRSLLNGCRMLGELELGTCVANQVLDLEPDNAATYVMVMEMYKAAGTCIEVAKLSEQMKRKVRKELGCSWVEIKGKLHLFTTRDETHQESDNIYMILKLMTDAMTGYAEHGYGALAMYL